MITLNKTDESSKNSFFDAKEPNFLLDFLDALNQPVFIKSKSLELVHFNYSFKNTFLQDATPQSYFGKLICNMAQSCSHNGDCTNQLREIFNSKRLINFHCLFKFGHQCRPYKIQLLRLEGELYGFSGAVGIVNPDSHFWDKALYLTARESDILSLIAGGLSVKSIANRLHISAHTVAHHLKNIYVKLNVNSKVAAINEANRLGLFEYSLKN